MTLKARVIPCLDVKEGRVVKAASYRVVGEELEIRLPGGGSYLVDLSRVERIVDDIDEIVRLVRFDGWQTTHAGEREVKNALRKTLFRYKLHQEQDLFDRAYGYIKQYY